MAVDTENKRRSVGAYAGGSGMVLPRPDGTVDAADRAAAAWIYSGLDYSGTPPPVASAYQHGIGIGKRYGIGM